MLEQSEYSEDQIKLTFLVRAHLSEIYFYFLIFKPRKSDAHSGFEHDSKMLHHFTK